MNRRTLALIALLASATAPSVTCAQAAPAAASAARVAALPGGMQVKNGDTVVRVEALTDRILRVRIARNGRFPEDASWAVPSSVRASRANVESLSAGFSTAAVNVQVDPATLALTVTDNSGKVIVADTEDPLSLDGKSFTLRKSLPTGERIYGLGDKTGGTLDRRGKSYVDWNTDAYGFDSSTDPIYKSIPFFVSVGGAGGAYGILLDNTHRTWFDFAHKRPDVLAMGGPDGPIDYYVIAGPAIRDVVRGYTDLTGKAPLPPQWSLGFQQSRYSYMSADEVRQIADRLRSERIPTDVLWLDIDFQERNRPFTVNRDTFPDLKGLVSDLSDKGLKLVTITDLHVAAAPDQGYMPYDTGLKQGAFVHNQDGSIYVGKVWPGPSVFPDFTDRKARSWWGSNLRQLVDDGVAGFWNDMNEPSVFDVPSLTMPLDSVHHIDSDDFVARKATHAEIHNVYGMENTRATYDGMKALRPEERGFVMTRATYAGGQRYAVTWTGDNSSTWDHLKLMVHQLINLGLSGFAYAGADIGGFTGGPSPGLMTRYFEIGAFTPIFRDHSAKDTPRAEPWLDGPEQLAIRRRFIEERYRLMPYLYALADHNARTGDPIMRPVFYDYPDSSALPCDQSMAFTLGSSLLVAPPPKPESPQTYDVCLPKGGWYDYWTGMRAPADVIKEAPKLDTLPAFVRAGTILPRQPLVQSTSETPAGPLRLDVYPGADCSGTLYFDDGHSMAFAKGHFLRQAIRCATAADGGVTIAFGPREGSFAPWWSEIEVTVHGRTEAGRALTVKGEAVSQYSASHQTLDFKISDEIARTQGSITVH